VAGVPSVAWRVSVTGQYYDRRLRSRNLTEDRMHPMFLPGVEASPQHDSPYTPLIEAAQSAGREYPKIWHLFAFRPHATQHLARFTQEILREEAPLSPGFRELIAARTSGRNDCPF
jgi:alkylhydroperoxidase family enzyme